MGFNPEYDDYRTRESKTVTEIGERRSDHSVVSRTAVPMPNPFQERELVLKSMWKKLDESTFFCSNLKCDHTDFPARPGIVRVGFRRSMKLTKLGPKLTLVEASASANLGGRIPRRINDTVCIPFTAASSVGLIQYARESASEAIENKLLLLLPQPVESGVVRAPPLFCAASREYCTGTAKHPVAPLTLLLRSQVLRVRPLRRLV
jgi:hypothetical protein